VTQENSLTETTSQEIRCAGAMSDELEKCWTHCRHYIQVRHFDAEKRLIRPLDLSPQEDRKPCLIPSISTTTILNFTTVGDLIQRAFWRSNCTCRIANLVEKG